MKKLVSIILSLLMVLSIVPAFGLSVFAEGSTINDLWGNETEIEVPIDAYNFVDENYDASLTAENLQPTIVKASNDGSVTIKSDHVQNKYVAYFKVTDQEAMKGAIRQACISFDGFLSIGVKMNSALNSYGKDCCPDFKVDLLSSPDSETIATTHKNALSSGQTSIYVFDVSRFIKEEYNNEIQYVRIEISCYDYGCGNGLGTQVDVTFNSIKGTDMANVYCFEKAITDEGVIYIDNRNFAIGNNKAFKFIPEKTGVYKIYDSDDYLKCVFYFDVFDENFNRPEMLEGNYVLNEGITYYLVVNSSINTYLIIDNLDTDDKPFSKPLAHEDYCYSCDYPCYKYFKLFEFGQDDYIEELSENVGSINFSEDGRYSVTPEENNNLTTLYFNISGNNSAKLRKAVMALKENPEFICQSYVGFSSSDENDNSSAIVRIGLLDENFETLESASASSSNHDISLKPVMAKYFCVTIKIKDAKESNSYKVSYDNFIFEWAGKHENATTERDVGGFILHTTYCTVCGYVFSGIPNPPNRHKTKVIPEVSASCKQSGLSQGSECKNCGEIVDLQTIIPKLNHTPSNEWVVITPATIDNEGKKGKKCTVCNEVIEIESIPKLDAPIIPDEPTKPIEKPTICAHIPVTKNFKVSTYFAKGYTGDKVCFECGEVLETGKTTANLTLKVPKFKSIKGKKRFKVKYTSVEDATGFQVRYRIKGKWKTKTFNTKKTATKIIKKLKAGKYQVQIRAMIVSGKQKAYSAWSKTQKVKVK